MVEPAAAQPAPPGKPVLERRPGVVVIGGSIEPAGVAGLCERARPMLADLAAITERAHLTASAPSSLVCDVATLRVDLAAVDVLAHLALTAHRLERRVRLRGAPPALRELLVLAGLADVMACDPPSGLDPGR